MIRIARILVAVIVVAFPVPVLAADCPSSVKSAAVKAHPDAKVVACKMEKEKGNVQYEVKLAGKGGKKLELDISPDGQILLTEEVVPLDTLPAAVLQGFQAKHPGAKPQRAEKQTVADGKISYEIAFQSGTARKEDTFAADGTFVEEE